MFAILALLIGIGLGIWLEPSLPTGLTSYLPVSYTHLTLPTNREV